MIKKMFSACSGFRIILCPASEKNYILLFLLNGILTLLNDQLGNSVRRSFIPKLGKLFLFTDDREDFLLSPSVRDEFAEAR